MVGFFALREVQCPHFATCEGKFLEHEDKRAIKLACFVILSVIWPILCAFLIRVPDVDKVSDNFKG